MYCCIECISGVSTILIALQICVMFHNYYVKFHIIITIIQYYVQLSFNTAKSKYDKRAEMWYYAGSHSHVGLHLLANDHNYA